MAQWTIKRLSLYHGDRRLFTCDDARLDKFFREQAGQYERKRLGRTYIATPVNADTAAGYYTIANASVTFEAVPLNVPRHPIPTLLIARLAVDTRYRENGLLRV
jgi:hypothetical protein